MLSRQVAVAIESAINNQDVQTWEQNPYLLIRVNGKDHQVASVKLAYDGVLGQHIVLEIQPLVV